VGFHTAAMVAPATQTPASARTYVGSGTCGDCHVSIYERWAKTRMANVVTDPKVRPQVVIPDMNRIFKRPVLWPGAISQDQQSCQFAFLLDKNPTLVPVGSAGERLGGRLWSCSLELRASSSGGLRWQAGFRLSDCLE